MISLIITGNQEERQNYIDKFCAEHKIDRFDVIIIQPDETKKTKNLGIENVRETQEKIYQKPLGEEKLVVFSGVELTHEAQNSLLKILEEPPLSTTIIISIEKINSLLPTILSRCTLIKLGKAKNVKAYPSIKKIKAARTGDKLVYAQNLGKTKEEALDFLLATIELEREEQHKKVKNSNSENLLQADLLEKLNQAYTEISSTNVSPRFALEILFLSL